MAFATSGRSGGAENFRGLRSHAALRSSSEPRGVCGRTAHPIDVISGGRTRLKVQEKLPGLVLAAVIAGIAVIAGVLMFVRGHENRGRIVVPVLLCSAFFVFSLMLQKITDYKLSIFGMMILFVVYFLPEGIIGFLRQLVAAALPNRRSTAPNSIPSAMVEVPWALM